MKLTSLFALLATLSILSIPTFAQDAVRPNPQVEAKAAQALLDVETQLDLSTRSSAADAPSLYGLSDEFFQIAISFARLGRTEQALRATHFMTIQDDDSDNGIFRTRDEILRLSVRRSALLGNTKKAVNLIPQIKSSRVRGDALFSLARAYLRKGNTQAAQKVLFQVSPLIKGNFEGTLYAAYLFSRSGEISVSKRLFLSAQKMLPRPQPASNENSVDLRLRFSDATTDRFDLSIFLLKAGLINQWLQFRKDKPVPDKDLDQRIVEQLIKLNRIDVAAQVARESLPQHQVYNLTIVAMMIAEEHPDQALSLLNEASEDLKSLPDKLRKSHVKETVSQAIQAQYLAGGYHQIGKEKLAQEWLQKGLKGATSDGAALLQIQYSLTPLFVQTNLKMKRTFPPDELSRINKEIKLYLPSIHIDRESLDSLKQLIEAQIKAGQIDDARDNIDFLDQSVMHQMASYKTVGDFDYPFAVAKLWKQANDGSRCEKMLTAIFNDPAKIEAYPKVDRAHTMILYGLVDEGLRFLHSAQKDSSEIDATFPPELAYVLAQNHPNHFPNQLLKQKSMFDEIGALGNYVEELTSDIFNAPGEQEFESDARGVFRFDGK